VDHKVNDWLDISVRQMVSFTKTKGHSDQSGQAQGMGYATPIGVLTQSDPTAAPKNPDGSWNEYVSWSGQTGNPHLIFDSDTEYNKTHTMRSLSSLDATIRFTDWLSLSNTFGYDYIDNKQYLWWAPSSIDGAALNGLSAAYIFQTTDLTNSTLLVMPISSDSIQCLLLPVLRLPTTESDIHIQERTIILVTSLMRCL
jgi:hypothetical protein